MWYTYSDSISYIFDDGLQCEFIQTFFILAYIRIKTNTTGAEFLYLPLEVEVTSQPGIYSPQEIIDFGLVPSKSDTKTVKLLVYNSGSKAIQVQNVIATPVTEAISVHFKPLKVQPETLRAKAIAEVTFNRKYILLQIYCNNVI